MVFLYKTKEDQYILSERPFGQTKKLGWEMLETFKTLDAAKIRCEKRYPNYTVDETPRHSYTVSNNTRKRIKKVAFKIPIRKPRGVPSWMKGRKWRPRLVAQFSNAKARAWANKPEMYFVVRPDGKCHRVWLPEGKEHAILPPGWRFGRNKGDTGTYIIEWNKQQAARRNYEKALMDE